MLTGCSKNPVTAAEPEIEKVERFKVIGYLFADGDLLVKPATIDFNKITHLNIAFINPDASGIFAPVKGLAELVKKAHQQQVKVIAAIAGGNPPQYLKDLLKPDKRKVLVGGLIQLTRTYNLDGIDVDLEGDFVNEDYEAFVTDLSAALKKENKLMTAAVATWNSAAYSDKALALFDLINIMSYDQTGPWRKDKPGPHSTYEAAEADFNHWNVLRNIPAERLILGLPFYAYGFGADIPESLTYGEIVQLYPGAEKVDLWELPGKGTFYYNGWPTLQKKLSYARQKKAGGVMIWQLLGDAGGALSLLNAIHREIEN
ncbi:hypothetical protein BFS30_04620 [Pedobacter steynii]|uniref:chitinase n=2 Tax=Pedobacter steynii TaxID=430522 RepID=A0A1D7QD53_9SPHI|nr:hypothetical protein BFS30_04620 [Pedobacter steynii]